MEGPDENGSGDAGPGAGADGVGPAAIRRAAGRIEGRVHRTGLPTATLLGRRASGVRLRLKPENLQKTGSFKVRGVLNELLTLDADEQRRGVVTVSAGNHAQALAWGARDTGIDCKVVMPETAPRLKVAACRGYGAEVILHGTVFDAFERALEVAEDEGRVFVHPFDDPDVVAGQGTVGLEIVEDGPEADAVVVPVGGGGLIAGVASAVDRLAPDTRVYGVEPEGAPSMRRSLDAGEPVRLDGVDTVADGLGSPMAGDLTYPLVRDHVDDVVLVEDEEIARAVSDLLVFTKLLAEPAGAAAVAALRSGRLPLEEGERVVAVVSGGNVDPDRLEELL